MKCPNCGKEFSSNFCPDCGYDPNVYSSNSSLNAKTSSTEHHVSILKVFILLVVAFGFIAFCVMIFSFFNQDKISGKQSSESLEEESVNSSLMTLYEFDKLSIGMSRSEVYDIVGSFGEMTSQGGSYADGGRIEMYSYEGYGDIGANALLTFINGKLDSKAQSGLKGGYSESTKSSSASENNSSLFSSESPVKISDIIFHVNVLPPNSINTVYAELSYENNSNCNITYLSVTALLKDQNEKTFYICGDTVLPGETSPIFDSFGPNTQLVSDIEFLKCEMTVTDSAGNKTFITYDYKLDSYKVL